MTFPIPTDHKEIALSQGTIRYRDLGDPNGEPLVFVHGLIVDGRLWDQTAELLAAQGGFRCLVPDWPMGAHTLPMSEDAELDAYGQARNVAEFVEKLGLGSATLVGNDSGGAISQIVATEHPGIAKRLILTNCDTFDKFPPGIFRALVLAARLPGAIHILGASMRIPIMRRSPIAYGLLTKKRLDGELLAHWVSGTNNKGVRRDTSKFLHGIEPEMTMQAAEKLKSADIPIRFAWAPEDKFFTIADAERLAAQVPDAEIERIDDSKTFVALDQPERLAEVIAGFMGAQTKSAGDKAGLPVS
jgi:pimeloyl-ACP methyl ester carboxylesterase